MYKPMTIGTTGVLAISGFSGSGKTRLTRTLTGELSIRGIRVVALKSTQDDVVPEKEGSDTAQFHQAGAVGTVLIGPDGIAVRGDDLSLDRVLRGFVVLFDSPDLILVEGFKDTPLPRIEVLREQDTRSHYIGSPRPPLLVVARNNPQLIAVPEGVPVVSGENLHQVVDLVLKYLGR